MDQEELDRLRERYRRLSDYDIGRLHADGPDAFNSPEAWEMISAEFERRGQAAEEAEEYFEDERETKRAQQEADKRLDSIKAPTFARVVATAVDLVLLWIVLALTAWAGGDVGIVFALIVAVCYHPISEHLTGRTAGKAFAGTRVVARDGGRASFSALIVRQLARPLIGGLLWYALIGTFAVHDRASGTRVVASGKSTMGM